MSQMNQTRASAPSVQTHGGAPAVRGMTPLAQLRRTVTTCLLWEDNFYENGQSVADRIKTLVPQCEPEDVLNLAVEVRKEFYLRHVPLLMVREMARASKEHKLLVPKALVNIINRPDELNEFLSIYWSDNKSAKGGDGKTLANSVKRGLAAAFAKFDEFALSKWDRKEKEVRIRDVMFYTHPKPKDLPKNAGRWTAAERKAFYAAKAEGTVEHRGWKATASEVTMYKTAQDILKQEETWEARMNAGEKAKVVFEDLMAKGELGGMAFIRNLRKMKEAGVDRDRITVYASTANVRGILPHQFLTAARFAPDFEPELETMMLRAMTNMEKLPGKTLIMVDVSGSMDTALSRGDPNKAQAAARKAAHARASMQRPAVEETKRVDAACGIAIMARELCESVDIYTFSDRVVSLPARRGMALRDAIIHSQPHSGTELATAVNQVTARVKYDRILVITDEQATDTGHATPHKGSRAYVMNVAPYQYSVATPGVWVSISGWSPQVLRYINEHEKPKD